MIYETNTSQREHHSNTVNIAANSSVRYSNNVY
uniref:Uncharacterized protein n=1 Tax=Anguilla anguilla TaxID=7936 RepID=A0A0E9PID4_ANGAN